MRIIGEGELMAEDGYLVQATVEQPWVLYKVMLVVYNLLSNNVHSGLDWAA